MVINGLGINTVMGNDRTEKLADYDGGKYLTGREGIEEFWVASPLAIEPTYIENFEIDSDRIKILRLGASFTSLAIRDGKDGAVINDRGIPVAIVRGVKAEDLTAESFIFGELELAQKLQNKLKGAIEGTIIPGIASMVVAPDGTVWNSAEGFANIETRELLNPDARLPANSTSKLFVATIVLQLMEEGKFNLDDSFGKYLPEVASQIPDSDKITIRQLLNHTSGISGELVDFVSINDSVIRAKLIADTNTPEILRSFLIKLKEKKVHFLSFEDAAFLERFSLTPERVEELNTAIRNIALDPTNYTDLEFTVKDYVALSYDRPLLSEPGTKFSYADTNQDILSLAIEKITGTSYVTQLRQRIFEPLGMNNTFYPPQEELPGGYPTLYSDSNNDGKTDTGLIDSVQSPAGSFELFGYAAGAVISTPSDMTRFVRAFYRGELLTPSTIEQVTSNGSPDFLDFNYGLSTMYRDDSTRGRIWGHPGGSPASSIWVAFFPDLNSSIVVMLNGGDIRAKPTEIDGKTINVEPATRFLFEASKEIVKQYPLKEISQDV